MPSAQTALQQCSCICLYRTFQQHTQLGAGQVLKRQYMWVVRTCMPSGQTVLQRCRRICWHRTSYHILAHPTTLLYILPHPIYLATAQQSKINAIKTLQQDLLEFEPLFIYYILSSFYLLTQRDLGISVGPPCQKQQQQGLRRMIKNNLNIGGKRLKTSRPLLCFEIDYIWSHLRAYDNIEICRVYHSAVVLKIGSI